MRTSRFIVAALAIGAVIAGCGDGEPDGAGSLHAVLPSTAVVGMPVTLAVSPLLDIGTPDPEWQGTLTIDTSDPTASTSGAFLSDDPGSLLLRDLVFATPGIHRVEVTASTGESATAGPILVVATEEDLRRREGERPLRVFWGDAHGHSDVGDGTFPPEQYFLYARNIVRLDFTCLSEHDFQQFLRVGFDEQEGSWESVAGIAESWRRPGFAVLLGWEWSSREHGHRVVLFPDSRSRYVSFREARTPRELATALEGTGAISVLAHPSGSNLTPAINWDTVVPGFDRAIEVYSGHGTMDGDSDFRPTTNPVDRSSALDAIRWGFRFSLVGFSDTHFSTPGNPHPAPLRDSPYRGGLTAVLAPEATEPEVVSAIAEGRCYATSGERFLVDFRVEDRGLGESLAAGPDALLAHGFAAGVGPWKRVEVMFGDRVGKELAAQGKDLVEFSVRVGPFEEETAVWLRGESVSGERFWTTPVWVEVPR